MIITIAAADDNSELERLYHWLRQDVDVSRSAKVDLRSVGEPGPMGALDVIDFAISNSAAVAALVVAYVSWRQSRPGTGRLTFTRGHRSVTVEGCSDEEMRRIVEMLADGRSDTSDAAEDADDTEGPVVGNG